jgi:hypothetical protein
MHRHRTRICWTHINIIRSRTHIMPNSLSITCSSLSTPCSSILSLGSTRPINMMGFLSQLKPILVISLGLSLPIRGFGGLLASLGSASKCQPRDPLVFISG